MTTYRHGQHGPEIVKIQENLIALGYGLPKYGADGWLGNETFVAIEEFEYEHGLVESCEPTLRIATVRKLKEIAEVSFKSWGPDSTRILETPLIDITEKTGKFRKGTRDWTEIDGIVLHQTGIRMTNSAKRFETLRAHIGIIRKPSRIVLVNPLDAYMHHAGRPFNSTKIGIEVNGLFLGVEGNRRTLPHRDKSLDNDYLLESDIQAIKDAVNFCRDEVAKHGGSCRYLYAHRQSSATRRADPGSLIWGAVAPWAREQGMTTPLNELYGKGRRIPRQWDEQASSRVKY
jgi:peptidoglycan hydrolase-like protein with peptidoglycan-binding domain